MARTPEGAVKEKVKKILQAHGVYYHMPVQNGMGKPSLDFVCCHEGRFLAIETKTEKGDLTLRQKATIEEMQKAGAIVLVIRGVSDGESFAILESFLNLSTPVAVAREKAKTVPLSRLFDEAEADLGAGALGN